MRPLAIGEAWDGPSRGRVLVAAFEAAWARRAPGEGDSIVRAATGLGQGCAEAPARTEIFDLALSVATRRPARRGAFTELAALAADHTPARPAALAAIRDAAGSATWRESALDALAALAADTATFDELASKMGPDEGAHRWPLRLAAAARALGASGPERVLRAAASVHPYYRALAHALVAGLLEQGARAAAIEASLRDDADPSLGDARPFVALAPWITTEAACRRAVTLASRLFPSPAAGATALAHLLPRLARLGGADEALALARAIPCGEERGVAVAGVGSALVDAAAQEATVLEGLALLEAPSGAGLATVAPWLVPLGYGPFLLERPGARAEGALHAMMLAARGAERAELAEALARVADPAWLEPLARELPAATLAPRVAWAIEQAASAPPGALLEDETGFGLVPWLPLVAPASEDEAALAIARALTAG